MSVKLIIAINVEFVYVKSMKIEIQIKNNKCEVSEKVRSVQVL